LNGGENPSDRKGNQLPVSHLSWKEADSYCKAIGGRLPTEKEREYAARAGTPEARYGPLDDIAWYEANSGDNPHPGGLKLPNAFGLYDMLGNVWEWTSNKYDYGEGVSYIARGGSWYSKPDDLRASQKYGFMTPIRPGYTGPGVRCVWTDAPF
jgi:formylglycine-generating enzyme required for sulfatase activity